MRINIKRLALIVIIFLTGLSLILAGTYIFILSLSGNIEAKINVIPSKSLNLKPQSPYDNLPTNFLAVLNQSGPYQPLNILLLGSDTRSGQGDGYGKVAGARSDTAMLLHLNAERTNITAISFPRDLWVSMPECAIRGGSENKFNAIFAYGGPGCTSSALATITGAQIDHVIVVDFNGFASIVDAIGGISLCLEYPIDDSKAHIQLPAGQQVLDGKQALGLARARYSLADGSDLSRIKRQQALLLTAVKEVKKSGIVKDPPRLYALSKTLASSLSVDESLASLPALTGLAWQVKDIPTSQIKFITVPYYKDDNGHFVVDYPKALALFQPFVDDSTSPLLTPITSPEASKPGKPTNTVATPKANQSGSTSNSMDTELNRVCSNPLF